MLTIFLLLFGLSTFSYADVMNLNEFMPTRMEDAAVTNQNQVELQGSVDYEDDEKQFIFRPNLRWGAYKRVQVEYTSDFISAPKGSETGSGAQTIGAQWNFNDQDNWVPSLAIEPQVIFPSGKDAHGADTSIKAILTYTLAGTITDPVGQFHLNYRWYNNADNQLEENKTGELFLLGYAHKISPHSSLLLDFVNEQTAFSSQVQNDVELGWIHEFCETVNIGLGAALDIKQGYYSSILSAEFHL
jgi:hypothetical protein